MPPMPGRRHGTARCVALRFLAGSVAINKNQISVRIAQSQMPQDLLTQLSKASGRAGQDMAEVPWRRAWHC